MKAIIIYKGKYGATKRYAIWLGKELDLPVKTAEKAGKEQLRDFDTVLIGSSVYIGKLLIRKWMKKHLVLLKDKKIFLFQVAGTPPAEIEKRQAYNTASLPGELVKKCENFYLHGRMIIKKLSWFDRFMLKMGARLTKDPDDRKTMLTDYDDVKKENLAELLEAVKQYATPQAPQSTLQLNG